MASRISDMSPGRASLPDKFMQRWPMEFSGGTIAVGAIRAGYQALIRSTFDLAQDFAEVEATGERRELVKKLCRVELLVLEDLDMKRLGPLAAEDLLEVFVRRHEAASTIVTTNRPTEDWGKFLGDVSAATAILDRSLAHAENVKMQGKSYRFRNRKWEDERKKTSTVAH